MAEFSTFVKIVLFFDLIAVASTGHVSTSGPQKGYGIRCYTTKDRHTTSAELLCAFRLTIVYVLIMVIVLIGLVKQMVEEHFCSVTNIFLLYIVGIFVITAILHPKEFTCVLYGLLYFVLTPSMSMLMVIYSIGNLNVVSWGTRETAERKTEGDRKQTVYGAIGSDDQRLGSLQQTEPSANTWLDDETLRESTAESLTSEEINFWKELIEKYLEPNYEDPIDQAEVTKDLENLRNKKCLQFLFANAIFIIVVFALQSVSAESKSFSIPLPCSSSTSLRQSIEPISVAFTLVFGILLMIQFLCMLKHRYATFLHVCASTKIFGNKEDEFKELYETKARAIQRPPEAQSGQEQEASTSAASAPTRQQHSIYYRKPPPKSQPNAMTRTVNRNLGMTLKQKLDQSLTVNSAALRQGDIVPRPKVQLKQKKRVN